MPQPSPISVSAGAPQPVLEAPSPEGTLAPTSRVLHPRAACNKARQQVPGCRRAAEPPQGTQSHPHFPDAHHEGPGTPVEPGAGGGAHLPWLAPGSYISSRFWKLMLAYALESSLGWPLPRGWLGDLGCGGGGGFPPDREGPSAAGCM